MTRFVRDAVEAALPELAARIAKAFDVAPEIRAAQMRGIASFERSTTVEECLTCERRERLFEAVPECREASPGACRFALRRVE